MGFSQGETLPQNFRPLLKKLRGRGPGVKLTDWSIVAYVTTELWFWLLIRC